MSLLNTFEYWETLRYHHGERWVISSKGGFISSGWLSELQHNLTFPLSILSPCSERAEHVLSCLTPFCSLWEAPSSRAFAWKGTSQSGPPSLSSSPGSPPPASQKEGSFPWGKSSFPRGGLARVTWGAGWESWHNQSLSFLGQNTGVGCSSSLKKWVSPPNKLCRTTPRHHTGKNCLIIEYMVSVGIFKWDTNQKQMYMWPSQIMS